MEILSSRIKMITTFQYPSQKEHEEIAGFIESLERKILDLRKLF